MRTGSGGGSGRARRAGGGRGLRGHVRAAARPSAAYRRVLAEFRPHAPFGAEGFDLAAVRDAMAGRHLPADAQTRIRRATANGVPGEWVWRPDSDPALRLLYLHGGGYVSGASGFYLAMAEELARQCRAAVFLANYRLAPEHPCPAAVEDAQRAFRWLRRHGPLGAGPARAVFVSGDSAGGGLTLALLLALRAAGEPLPAGAIPISAYTDLAHTGASVRTRAALDPVMSPRSLPWFAAAYLGGLPPTHPLASPLYGDYRGLPPLLLQVGDWEIIRDDSVRVARKARAAGVDVTLEVWDGMIHVWHSQAVPILPEGKKAIAHIARFVRRLA